MTKQDYIKYWIDSAENDWGAIEVLFESKQYVYSLFWGHLVLEKLAKVLWVQNMEDDIPPRVHNIVYLLDQAEIEMNIEDRLFLSKMNDLQLEGRYPDYLGKVHKRYDKETTTALL